MAVKYCNGCGAVMVREGNFYKCSYCPNLLPVDIDDDANAVAVQFAWENLRKSDFDKAAELFEELLVKDKNDYLSHWGLALAKASVVYVNDIENDKKVPTLNNISEFNFLEDKHVKQAIALAPAEIAESYKTQAEYIEKVRKEWLDKASKEPPYDIFISFKDSDREHGIDRTPDSVSAQDLYTALTEKGYKVFYSRVSLRGKVAEQYEPYIYNAIKTAKVMLVYGEKAEYFSAPWIKNEWMRFKKRVEAGEKHKNALVTVFKGVNPYDIPTALTGGKQGVDLGVVTNYETLMNHIKLVVDQAKHGKQLDKVEIKGGQMGKRSSQITTERLVTKEVGKGSLIETSLSEKQQLSLVKTYIKERYWEGAMSTVTDLLMSNPNFGEAIWYQFLIGNKCSSALEIAESYDYDAKVCAVVDRVLSCADEGFAKELLPQLYDIGEDWYSEDLLKTILPYNFSGRKGCIDRLFNSAINNSNTSCFDQLISTLDPNEVDRYINLNLQMAKKVKFSNRTKYTSVNYAKKVIAVDEGNLEALEILFKTYLKLEEITPATEHFESYLKYSKNVQEELTKTFDYLSQNLAVPCHADFAMKIIKYCNGEFATTKQPLIKLALGMISNGNTKPAKEILEVINTQDQSNAEVFWGLCLIKAGALNEKGLVSSNIDIFNQPEFHKYMALVDEKRRSQCLSLRRQREQYLEQKRQKEEQEKQEKIRAAQRQESERLERIAEYERRQKEENKAKGVFALKIIAFLLCYALIAFTIAVVANSSLLDFMDEILDLGDTLFVEEMLLPFTVIVCSGVLGALSVFVFEWWDGDFADGWRVVAGIVLGLFINVIMVIISIVAFFKLIIRGWDY